MGRIRKIFIYIIPLLVLFSVACRRELSCENCNGTGNNQPPVAKAGPDQHLLLPKDSALLDGSASADPDGSITAYKWTKISGPTSFNLANSDSAKTMVRSLTAGVYLFELTVTDNGGLSAKDTVQVIADSAAVNHPPVACAGDDQTVLLPSNLTSLDGRCSTDPENNIAIYQWTKIAGPASFHISHTNAVQTDVTNLEEGIYQFTLKVTDSGGLSAVDTVKLTVRTAVPAIACDGSSRPQVAARLTTVGTLSTPRDGLTIGSAGTKIVFAGGVEDNLATTAVDIYDTATRQWSTATLSQPRLAMAAVTAGNKLFLAGGNASEGDSRNAIWPAIDVYDAGTNTWSVMSLSERRGGIAGAAIGNKVFFAGGGALDYYYTSTGFGAIPLSDKVDIYDLSTASWSTATLSEARFNSAAVVVGNKLYFAGGYKDRFSFVPSDRVDIYDNATQSWSTSSLPRPMGSIAGAAIDDKIVWAEACNATIRNTTTGVDASLALSHSGAWYADFGLNAVTKDKTIVFFHHRYDGTDGTFDIYNTATGKWSVGVLPEAFAVNAVFSFNNTIYLVGGVNEDYKEKCGEWSFESWLTVGGNHHLKIGLVEKLASMHMRNL